MRANYGEIPPQYSEEVTDLIAALLQPNPEDRPSINAILRNSCIAQLARDFLTDDEFIAEFSHTVLHNENVFA